ncbi:hypothetical protein NM688_g2369 [Phlebia brevispora]|uniref:Uncharacterized protein n=1 Tax=Phlebia brevispora TaxID=194682 RepID=A0ACC1T8K3_9APHY|nr:hypothetical protein NM688_g2369 [Phlebia brevispora]
MLTGDNRVNESLSFGGPRAVQKYQTSPASLNLPDGWRTGMDCAVDPPSRVIANDNTTLLSNDTPATCATFCQGQGYEFAGVEYVNERHCGTGYADGVAPEAAPTSDCNLPCNPNKVLSLVQSIIPTYLVTLPHEVSPGIITLGPEFQSCLTHSATREAAHFIIVAAHARENWVPKIIPQASECSFRRVALRLYQYLSDSQNAANFIVMFESHRRVVKRRLADPQLNARFTDIAVGKLLSFAAISPQVLLARNFGHGVDKLYYLQSLYARPSFPRSRTVVPAEFRTASFFHIALITYNTSYRMLHLHTLLSYAALAVTLSQGAAALTCGGNRPYHIWVDVIFSSPAKYAMKDLTRTAARANGRVNAPWARTVVRPPSIRIMVEPEEVPVSDHNMQAHRRPSRAVTIVTVDSQLFVVPITSTSFRMPHLNTLLSHLALAATLSQGVAALTCGGNRPYHVCCLGQAMPWYEMASAGCDFYDEVCSGFAPHENCCAGEWGSECALGTDCGPPVVNYNPGPLPSGWSTLAPCVQDNPSRIFENVVVYNSSTNTAANCATTCGAQGYPYAGVEYGEECLCGTGLTAGTPENTTIDESNCDMVCLGNTQLSCGGSWALQLYQGPQATLDLPAGWMTAIPCAVDTSSRVLANDVITILSNNTAAVCATHCQSTGYTFAGVEYGTECHCGTGYAGDVEPVEAPVSDCNMPCNPDKGLMCGGSWRIQIYEYTGN